MKSIISSPRHSSLSEKNLRPVSSEPSSARLTAEKAVQRFADMAARLAPGELEDAYIRLIVRRGF